MNATGPGLVGLLGVMVLGAVQGGVLAFALVVVVATMVPYPLPGTTPVVLCVLGLVLGYLVLPLEARLLRRIFGGVANPETTHADKAE